MKTFQELAKEEAKHIIKKYDPQYLTFLIAELQKQRGLK